MYLRKNYPTLIGFPLTNKCQGECELCQRKKLLSEGVLKEDKDMSDEEVMSIIQKIKGRIEIVNLSAGYGETALYPGLSLVLRMFADADISTLIYSHSRYYLEFIKAEFLPKLLILSLDSFHNDESFDLIDFFSKCILLNERTDLIINYVVDLSSDSSLNYLERVLSLNRNIFKFEIKWRCFYDGKQHFATMQSYNKFKGLILDYESKRVAFPKLVKHKSNQCIDNWKSLYFTKEGYLRDCCFDYRIVGMQNILHDSLEDIWKSIDIQEIIKSHVDRKNCEMCPIGYGFLYELLTE